MKPSLVPLKKLHSLILKTFFPPFIGTLFVSVFLFFLVQIVITYLDDLIGKGISTIDLFKLFGYAWIAIIPQCIPLAVLLGSIMCFGNLAETYELAAMKSSGLSLFRIIKPVFMFIVCLAGMTFVFNNFILPIVTLKSQSLLWDIRQKKPAVFIKESTFYNKIDNYSIRAGKKSKNNDTLKDLLIYDHSAHQGNIIQLYSKYGLITQTSDSNYLVLKLLEGNRYENIKKENDVTGQSKPMMQLNFKRMQVNIPLVDFKLKRTDEEQFKGHGEMLNIWQIDSVSDSMRRSIKRRYTSIDAQAKNYFFTRSSSYALTKNPSKYYQPISKFYAELKKEEALRCMENALNIVRSASAFIDGVEPSIAMEEERLTSFTIEWHSKIAVCFACFVLFFVGAPLGAIIKKGGMGLPVVVAVFFFLAYFILTEGFRSAAAEGALAPWMAMWAPLAIFLPISVFLTYKAAKDSTLFNVYAYFGWLIRFVERFTKKEKAA
jgi:lipopolysaccharide export system permease protein